jgi:hypothetical protein
MCRTFLWALSVVGVGGVVMGLEPSVPRLFPYLRGLEKNGGTIHHTNLMSKVDAQCFPNQYIDHHIHNFPRQIL